MTAIEINGLCKTIKGHEVLNNINLQLEKGKIYGFFGRNGSGKTMLFRAICGLIKPTSGIIKVFNEKMGEDISFPRSIGVIIENVGLWPSYTGFQNLKFLASIKSIVGDEEIKKSIERVGLNPADKKVFRKYSLGMKQRIGIAQAIMEQPDLIVLDEPTNALDEEGIDLVRNILLEEKKRGATILIASHNKDDIDILSDQKFKMDRGLLTKYESETSK